MDKTMSDKDQELNQPQAPPPVETGPDVPEPEAAAPDEHAEAEIYEVAPKLTNRDIAGVAAALVALAVIGVAGYIWLTPGLTFSGLFQRGTTTTAVDTTDTDQAVTSDADPGAAAEEVRCPYCGMFADRSLSHVDATWADGAHTHHDSWDCVFLHAMDNGLELDSARVTAYDSAGATVPWLDAAAAWYLFDTQRIKGSMPPYVAAFSSQDAAAKAQPQLGGEIVDFDGLRARWNQ